MIDVDALARPIIDLVDTVGTGAPSASGPDVGIRIATDALEIAYQLGSAALSELASSQSSSTALTAAVTKTEQTQTSTRNLADRGTDIAGVVRLARGSGARVACDNTWATPLLQRPLTLGADLVMHSTTKYLGGHGDLTGGAIVARAGDDDPVFERVRLAQTSGGAVPSPFDCWLTLRGLKTLELRMERHALNATAIADALVRHPLVRAVYFPGHADHPGHQIAQRQMTGFGGMVSFELDGTVDEVVAFVSSRRFFALGESLGGVKSLLSHPARMTHASIPAETRHALGLSDTLIRLSPGCEHPNDLVADLIDGLDALAAGTHRASAVAHEV